MAGEQVRHVPSFRRPPSIDSFRSRNPSDTLRFNYLDNDDTELESLIAKHRKLGTSILQQADSEHEFKHTSKERPTRGRTDERYEHSGPKRRSQSLVGASHGALASSMEFVVERTR